MPHTPTTTWLVTLVDTTVVGGRPDDTQRVHTLGEARALVTQYAEANAYNTELLQQAEQALWFVERWTGGPAHWMGTPVRVDVDVDPIGTPRTWQAHQQIEAQQQRRTEAGDWLRHQQISPTDVGWDGAVDLLAGGGVRARQDLQHMLDRTVRIDSSYFSDDESPLSVALACTQRGVGLLAADEIVSARTAGAVR